MDNKNKTRIKPLLPSLKEKKRYITFEVISKEKSDFSKISKLIWDSCLTLLGTHGCAKAGIWVMEEQWKNQKGMIRTNNKYALYQNNV